MIKLTMIPWLWAIGALLLAFVELNAPGYYLIWIACAAAITSVVTFNADVTISQQIVVFAVSSVVTCVAGHFIYRRWLLPHEDNESNLRINRPDTDMVGLVGVASETFRNGAGKVRLGDTYWLAESSEDIAKDAAIIVRAVRGTAVVVAAHR